jgi:indolepyruvate ferredoxin oxidoreductase alpha subunit
MRANVEKRLVELAAAACKSPANRIQWRDRAFGIVTSSVAYQYVRDIWPEASVLKLGFAYPFPDDLIREFAAGVRQVMVVEELDDFIEEHIKALGIPCVGKQFVPRVGELSPTVLRAVRNQMEGKPVGNPPRKARIEDLPARPPVLCPGCPHRGIFVALKKHDVVVTGDIGCYSLGVFKPLDRTDVILCMGGGISMAQGFDKAREPKKVVGIVGDSTFFHSGITGLLDITYNRGVSTIIVADNRTTGMTGHQDHPGTGRTLMGESTIEASIADIARACGVKRVREVNPYDQAAMQAAVTEELAANEPSLIVSKAPCPLHVRRPVGPRRKVDSEKCRNCKVCLGIGCPAMEGGEGKPHVSDYLCAGCGLCEAACKFGAISVADA